MARDVEKVAIIGLGLIGGSIGLALKRAGLKDVRIAGNARTRDTLQRAKRLGAIDEDCSTPAEAAKDARLVIIACPILATKPVLKEIAPVVAEGAVVTDAGSTKGNVMRWAREILPERAFFVGGHPMAGKESSGIDAAEADLFRDKTWVVVPSVDAPEPAVRTVLALVQACGAKPVFMDADEHDSYVAAISHLPLTLASALFSVAFGSAAWPELAGLASSGFRDTTRLASGSPEMAHDIVMTNRENLLHWIDRFQEELARFREMIASGESKQVLEAFGKPQVERDHFMLNGPPRRETAGPEIERTSLSEFLLGSTITGYLKKQQEMIRGMEAREKRR
jgi:prephenate dehydrogenase